MSSVLTGNLAYLEVINILKLLSSGSRDGKLILQKEDQREIGEIYLKGGKIVHAVCDTYLGEPAFNELILWRSGKFAFEPDATTNQQTIDKDTQQLLNEGAQFYQAWERIRHTIPSFNIKFKKTGQPPPPNVKLKGRDWEVLNLFESGEVSVSEAAQKLSMRDLDIAGIIHALIEAGVIAAGSLAQPVKKETLNENFFKNLENELIQLMGPVASIIIDDVVESFGEDRKSFPRDKVAGLVESISNEIYDPAKQVTFQQYMLKQIKSL